MLKFSFSEKAKKKLRNLPQGLDIYLVNVQTTFTVPIPKITTFLNRLCIPKWHQFREIKHNKFSYWDMCPCRIAKTQKLCIIITAKCGHFSWHMEKLPCCLQLPVQFQQRDSLTHRFVWDPGGLCKFPVFGMHSLHIAKHTTYRKNNNHEKYAGVDLNCLNGFIF